jgi:hypothetical protein
MAENPCADEGVYVENVPSCTGFRSGDRMESGELEKATARPTISQGGRVAKGATRLPTWQGVAVERWPAVLQSFFLS